MGHADDERTAGWVNGDPVTNRITGDLGTVKWTYPRKSDGKRFLRVRVHGRDDVWENGHWILGQGFHQRTCYECGYPFKTEEMDATFCLACARHQRPKYERDARSATHSHLLLHGNATPYPAPAPAEPVSADVKDEDETPF